MLKVCTVAMWWGGAMRRNGVLRSATRARLALCAKVAGVSPVQWNVTTVCDVRRRFLRVDGVGRAAAQHFGAQVRLDVLDDGRVRIAADRPGGVLDARYAPVSVDDALCRVLPQALGELGLGLSAGAAQ